VQTRLLWRQDFILSGKCKLKTRTHMGELAPTWENVQPTSLVATRFHLVGEVQVENSHPHGRTRTHMGKRAPTWENSHPQFKFLFPRLLLVATRFHLVEGKCKLKTRTHMGKLAPTWGKLAPTWGNLQHVLAMAPKRPGFQKADQTAGKRCRNGCVNRKSRASIAFSHRPRQVDKN